MYLTSTATPLEALCCQQFPDGLPVSVVSGLPDLYRHLDGSVFWRLDLDRLTETQQQTLRDWCAADATQSQLLDWSTDLVGVSNRRVSVSVWQLVITGLLIKRLSRKSQSR